MIRSRALGALQHKRDSEASAERKRESEARAEAQALRESCRMEAARNLCSWLKSQLGIELAPSLLQYTDKERIVPSRNERWTNEKVLSSCAYTLLDDIEISAADFYVGVVAVHFMSTKEGRSQTATVKTAAELGALIEAYDQRVSEREQGAAVARGN